MDSGEPELHLGDDIGVDLVKSREGQRIPVGLCPRRSVQKSKRAGRQVTFLVAGEAAEDLGHPAVHEVLVLERRLENGYLRLHSLRMRPLPFSDENSAGLDPPAGAMQKRTTSLSRSMIPNVTALAPRPIFQ